MQKRIRMNQIIYKERKNTNSIKWDNCGEKFGNEKLLPLWVADMDFEVPDIIIRFMHTQMHLSGGRKHITIIR